MNVPRRLFAALLTAGLALLAGCRPAADDPGGGRLQVVATTTMLLDMVTAIAGEHADVHGMMGPGQDPHNYEPSFSDIESLEAADLVVLNGHLLEGQMGEILAGLGQRGEKRILAVAEELPAERILHPASGGEHADPHVWGDASLWAECVGFVSEAMASADPDHAGEYRSAGSALRDRYLALHEWIGARIRDLPEDQRVLITSHDAFNYLGRAYGIEVLGVQGISTETEAGLADISKAVDLIRDRGVKAIFPESSVPPATIERICEDSGARRGDELFSDALGIPGDSFELGDERYDKGTYEGMMRYNVQTIVTFLSH